MGLLDWLFSDTSTNRKRVFISFAIEDIKYRDYLVKQARDNRSPFDFIDMSVKRKWSPDKWKNKCRTKIKRCHGVIALLSKNTHLAHGARWEMKCAREERKNIIGVHIFKSDKGVTPPELKEKR